MSERRVAITGVGVISPVAQDKDGYWRALLEGRSGVARITLFDASQHTTQIAAEVKGFDPDRWLDKRLSRRLDRFAQFGLAAAIDAVKDAGIQFDREDPTRCGAVVGTGIGGLTEIEDQHDVLRERGPGRLSPFVVPKLMGNAASGQVGILFNLQGPNLACISACASAANSLLEAARIIQRGEADIMIAGGCEAAITPLGVGGFCAAKALSRRNDDPEHASRPFDRDRDGFVIGEGAGVVVMEEFEHARRRGADIYALVAGGGMTCDAFHITQPEPDGRGAAACMVAALRDARIGPDDVTYINAHGTSTELNDIMETKAIRSALGPRSEKVPISSTKSMVGHLLGASGGVEIVACALSMKYNVVHPTANLEYPDPQCDLDYVPREPREVPMKALLCNSFGFGGHNVTLVLTRPD